MTNQWMTTVYDVPRPSLFEGNIDIPASTIQFQPIQSPIVLSETTLNGKRWYTSDGEHYPSITTLIGATDVEGKLALEGWKSAIGEEAATNITKRAADRGIKWHKYCELYVQGLPVWQTLTDPGDMVYGYTLAQVLNCNVKRVFASETRVLSTKYGIAGRLDLGVDLHSGRHAILDFKTGRKAKEGNRLNNYALQSTFYADAVKECLWIPVETIVVMQLLPKQILWQESGPVIWRSALRDRVKQYADMLAEVVVD